MPMHALALLAHAQLAGSAEPKKSVQEQLEQQLQQQQALLMQQQQALQQQAALGALPMVPSIYHPAYPFPPQVMAGGIGGPMQGAMAGPMGMQGQLQQADLAAMQMQSLNLGTGASSAMQGAPAMQAMQLGAAGQGAGPGAAAAGGLGAGSGSNSGSLPPMAGAPAAGGAGAGGALAGGVGVGPRPLGEGEALAVGWWGWHWLWGWHWHWRWYQGLALAVRLVSPVYVLTWPLDSAALHMDQRGVSAAAHYAFGAQVQMPPRPLSHPLPCLNMCLLFIPAAVCATAQLTKELGEVDRV